MESKQILDKLNQARRALDSLSQVEIMNEWQFDNELNVWYLHLSIVIECETPYFPQKSQWFFVVGSEYPKGKIKVYPDVENSIMVLCQDLVQVKMRNFSDFNPPEAQPQCVFFYTIVRIHLVTYSYNGYEFVSYCRKLPDIRKSSSMPACNREF